MKCNRRCFLEIGALGFASVATNATAQVWPSKPIRLIVPFPPGGLIDNMARLLAPKLAQELGQAVVIENKAGAGGTLGASEAAKSVADGYTLLMASPPLTIAPALYKNMLYKAEQIEPIGLIGRVPNVLLVNPKSDISTVHDLVKKAKNSPGKMNYASNGNGTSLHLSAELFKKETGTFITHIPYRGAAAAVTAVMSGEVDMMFENLPSVLGQISSGHVKALAVTTRRRNKSLPNVPTMVELGFADFDVSSWYGLAAPTGIPSEVIKKLEMALEKASKDPEIRKTMEDKGADVGFLGASIMGSFMAADSIKWKRVANFAKIEIN